VVGEARDGAEAVEFVRRYKPDLLLLDLAMPRVTGLGALKELASTGGNVFVILLTAQIERPDIVTALQLGARGVVLKEAATQALLESIHAVMDGHYWVGREAVGDLVLRCGK
jgi:DNA-binding NarL/FixJ family response regulator